MPPPPPKKKCPASPQKILSVIIPVYITEVTISEKTSRRHDVSAHTVTFLKIESQNAPDCISAHIELFISRNVRGPPRKLVAFAHSGRLPLCIQSTFMDVICKKTFSKMECFLKKLGNSLYIPPTLPHTTW